MTTSDASGHFSYDGTFSMPVTLRATKDGYATATVPARAVADGRAYASFQLGSVTPPVAIAGSYTLTITADSACTTLPDDVRARTYRATVIAATNTTAPAGTYFNGP
jgi:hypothetical protein